MRAEVPTGLVVLQEKVALQLLAPEAMVQARVAGVMSPDIASAPVVNVPSGEYPVPVELVA